jgi:hypothetical protein
MLEVLAQIEWNKFWLVAQATIVFAVGIVGVFSLGIRLLTNAQNAVPGANKGKSAAIRAEVLNRLAAYIAFALCVVALGYGIQLVAPWIFGIAS